MKTLVLSFCLSLLGVPLSATAAPQSGGTAKIVVHLIDARNGRPIPHKPVRMWSLDSQVDWRGHLEQKTDANGVAVFHLPEPLPRDINIHTGMGGYWEDCSSAYNVEDVLKDGVTREVDNCLNLPRLQDRFHPKPGEVYFFAVHATLWEHMKLSREND